MDNKYKGFNLKWVLIIVSITSIISALTTGVIIYNNNKITNKVTYADLAKDENLNQFLEVYANIISEYYEDINKKELLEKAIAGMMNYLGDDYSTYLNDKATDSLFEQLVGEYTGIGISINNSDKTITKVYDDTPAYSVGIQPGDVIVGVDDKDVTTLSANDIVALIKNHNDYFSLKLKRGEEIISVSLRNEKIISPSIDYYIIENTNIGYLSIAAFSNTLDKQVRKALTNLESSGINSLIIDLRDDTGGFLDAAKEVASMFLEKGKRIYSLSDKQEVTHYKDESEEQRNYKIVILTNGNTASASEILAAALKESYGAVIVGETTFGKGKVQQTMKLDDGSMVKYTSAYWLTPEGKCIDEVGIIPDYQVSNENVTDENGTVVEITDKQLQRAVQILTGA